MELSLQELLDGTISRLRYVFRYSTSRVQAPESVAEHSYFVALYCMLIGDWTLANTKEKPRMELLLRRAMLHDAEEARSGDFPRTFKHSSANVKKVLEAASREAMVQLLTPLSGSAFSDFGSPSSTYLRLWENAKDASIEGRILEFADFLSVLGFLLQECDGGNRKAILRHVGDMETYFKKFKGQAEYAFLSPLLKQAQSILEEVFHGSPLS